ncbi:aminotransferase class I/II-fold pyridoxal phosphate-dependent enzyme [Rathayibacter sp. VKM Ac-2803]|uniref:DegT/DnrJ/EryC1/StrS family aminotransferase n=1 Tax=unclassified Rathayibacter TaxID=2609250 RepID=UPI001358B378|nr:MULTISPECIES: DegT/DnrJ/EryC1/StrS family aminotransferase [unclassified Rathayibacter]MWV49737.1 aminotransferase class I/II-fold pyridoxal phosphate-dependent enzyme [Rathayibacter sp. VKM Ac-2803]MWV59870.1 aminotransferase class I/II-fold pyridoxal phosphate-dependent enzyme [Rathayibacter sp. VKM Ac-2754]
MTYSEPIVPLADLHLQHLVVADVVREGFDRVLAESSFVRGPDVTRFEEEFAAYCGVRHTVGVGNGTDALELALLALELRPGDEVLVPANTFVATAEAVMRAGATPVFVDCDDDYLIDVASAAAAVTPRTRAVMAVHLYGQCAPVEQLAAALGPAVTIVEDAAQAQGARRFGARAGSLGAIAGTSFYPGKNLGAYGDAGGVMTDDDELAAAVRRLGNHGGLTAYRHEVLGTNSRLDSLQAVVLSAKLAHLDEWNRQRREAAARYGELLDEVGGLALPRTAAGNEHVHHLYVVRTAQRDRVREVLGAAGIATGVHYPQPVHLMSPFLREGRPAVALPNAEAFAGELLTLPLFPGITAAQQEYVAQSLVGALRVGALR